MKAMIGWAGVAVLLSAGCSGPWRGGPGHVLTGAAWTSVLHAIAPTGELYVYGRRVYSGARGESLVQAMVVPDPLTYATLSLDEVVYNGSPAAGLNLKRGFAYLIGRWPIVIVKGGSGAGDGTKIGARVIPSTSAPNHTRLFLINPVDGQKLVVLVEKGPDAAPERYELAEEGCIEISDEDGDGIGKYESTTTRRNAAGEPVWDSTIEEEYQTLLQNAAEARLDF